MFKKKIEGQLIKIIFQNQILSKKEISIGKQQGGKEKSHLSQTEG